MASLRRNVFLACTNDPTLGGLIADRCYPTRLPAGVSLPAISYRQISDDDTEWRAHGEATTRSIARVSFDCWADSSDETAEVADALIALWSGYQAPPDIGWGQIALRLDDFEESLGRHRTVVDVRIDYAR